MATRKNTSIESVCIAGAKKGLAALRKLEQEAEAGIQFDTASEYYAQRLCAVRALVAELGPMTPEQEGAVAVLVEFIAQEFSGSTPNLTPGGWTPLSAMTEAERTEMAEQMDAEHEADDIVIEAACKVVSIASRRAAQ